MRIFYFNLFCIIVNFGFGFGSLVGQSKLFEDVVLSSWDLWCNHDFVTLLLSPLSSAIRSFILHLVAPREIDKAGQWIQWCFGLSYFHWNFLGWGPSPPRGKPLCSHANTTNCVGLCIKCMCVHIHAHMHNPTQFLMQFTEPCPIMAWSYHISKNTRFSTNTWSDQGRSSCTQDPELFSDGEISWCYQGLNMSASPLQRCVTAKVTGNLLTSGPTTRHSWLQ